MSFANFAKTWKLTKGFANSGRSRSAARSPRSLKPTEEESTARVEFQQW